MKSLTYLMLGLVVGVLVQRLIIPHAGRYVVGMQGDYLIRTDTDTGRTWRFQGGWIVMPDAPKQEPAVATSATPRAAHDQVGGVLVISTPPAMSAAAFLDGTHQTPGTMSYEEAQIPLTNRTPLSMTYEEATESMNPSPAAARTP